MIVTINQLYNLKKNKLYRIKNILKYSYFDIFITFDLLPWGCLMIIIQESANSLDNFTISYNNVDIVWEVNGILRIDNKE